MKKTKIICDDLTKNLYQYHLDKKNIETCNVLKVFLLKNNFQELLDSLLKNDNNEFLLPTIFAKDKKLISIFINEILKSEEFLNKTKHDKENFGNIAWTILNYTYATEFSRTNDKKKLLNRMIIKDKKGFNPSISMRFYEKDLFWEIFNNTFFKKGFDKIIKKYNKHPIVPPFISNKILNIRKDKSSKPKICQLIFDETTGKQELLKYINKEWDEIKSTLNANRPEKNITKIKASATFLRDIDIYNKYQDFMKEGFKNPDVKVDTWLKKSKHASEDIKDIKPNTIRKIVSLLKKEINELNKKNK